MLGKVVTLLAVITLLHAAFSSYEHLSHLKALGKPEGSIPPEIVAEAFLSLVLGILGASLSAPTLKEITWKSEMKQRTCDEMDSRLSFANWVNRGNKMFTRSQSSPQQIKS